MATAPVPSETKSLAGIALCRDGIARISPPVDLMGDSDAISQVRLLIEKVAQRACPVLVTGETGTGKEVVARSIHARSWRFAKPFAVVDCAAISPTLIESELFGYARGAFTGADRDRRGLLESAADGTCFFDEIGELPISLQGKILRVLQESEFRPVGCNQTRPIQSRTVAATNRDLQELVRAGTFREDLLYRLNVATIVLPPLRKRKEDIPILINHFLAEFGSERAPVEILPLAMARLLNYRWPGNVRELKHAIERSLLLGDGEKILFNDLPPEIAYPEAQRIVPDDEILEMETMEKRMIYRALQRARGDKLMAARILGIGKTTIYRKLQQYETRMAYEKCEKKPDDQG